MIHQFTSLNKAPQDVLLKSDSLSLNGMSLNSLKLNFGSPDSKKSVWANLELQLGLPYVVIGNKNTSKWGIPCDEGSDNKDSSCQFSKVNLTDRMPSHKEIIIIPNSTISFQQQSLQI